MRIVMLLIIVVFFENCKIETVKNSIPISTDQIIQKKVCPTSKTLVELLCDTSLFWLPANTSQKIEIQFPHLNKNMDRKKYQNFSATYPIEKDTLRLELIYDSTETKVNDSLFNANLKSCSLAKENFIIWDSVLSKKLASKKESGKSNSSQWKYENLPQEIYNRESFSWIVGKYSYNLSWDVNDTACVVLSVYPKILEEEE